jgi:hypothetical protein
MRVCIRFIWLRTGPVTNSCEHGIEAFGSVKEGKFLNQLSEY